MQSKFFEMVDNARTYGVVDMSVDRPRHGVQFDKLYENGKRPFFPEEIKELFFNVAAKNNVFIFHPKEDTPSSITEIPEDHSMTFDSPFDVISIEMIGDNYLTIERDDDDFKMRIMCVLYDDITGALFMYNKMSLRRKSGEEEWKSRVSYINSKLPNTSDSLMQLLSIFVGRINSEKVGREMINEKLKIKTPGGSRFIRFNQLIYVSQNKTTMKIMSESSGRNIDYSHRFFRRGHWMKQDPEFTGKDRQGVRNQKGRTWRMEAEVGDKNLPLINKTRVVSANAQ